MNVLEITNLTKSYETGHRAVDGLTLSVAPGTIFGFIGLNGAGKTSTIRIIAGLSRADGGTVNVFGQDIAQTDGGYLRQCGFVLDEPLYFDWMSAGEYLRFAGQMYGLEPADAQARTDELLEFFDLAAKGEDPIDTFSTGMKKKVSLAAAIIHAPKLIVLDEPFEGIDALAASSIKTCLSMMAAKGVTVFITSHVLDTVEKFCSEVAIVDHGKILLQCLTRDIRRNVKGKMRTETFATLEDLFIELVAGKKTKTPLSYL